MVRRSFTARNLVTLREAAGLDVSGLAHTTGISRKQIGEWENHNKPPSRSKLLALANLYGVDPDEITADKLIKPPQPPSPDAVRRKVKGLVDFLDNSAVYVIYNTAISQLVNASKTTKWRKLSSGISPAVAGGLNVVEQNQA